MRGQGVGQKTWAFYLFYNLDQVHVKVARHKGLNDDAILERISELEATSYVTEFDKEGFKVGTQFASFHYQARHMIFDRGLITRVLML